jgi:hypothetical protein
VRSHLGDVGLREVVPCEQQRNSGYARHRIRQAIAKVESCRVATFAIAKKSVNGGIEVLGSKRYDLGIGRQLLLRLS